jgi:hypothetical protein
MEAQTPVEFLRSDGDGLTRMGGVPAELVQAVTAEEEILAVTEEDGVLGSGYGEGGKTRQHEQKGHKQGGRADGSFHGGILLWDILL